MLASGRAPEIARHGHDVLWAGSFPGDPADDEFLAFALNEGRVVVTLDKDFGELAVAFGRMRESSGS